MLKRFDTIIRRYLGTGFLILLALPASTNYKLHDFGFGGGGVGDSTSTNYRLNGIVGEESSGGTATGSTYNLGPGLIFTQQANEPIAPTFTNPANYYNKLHLVVNTASNPTDTKFAIAISTDNFTTTQYIQSDYTVGSALGSEDYLTYANWGGASGVDIIKLAENTTYKVKVKAIQGTFTETAYGPTASAATVTPTMDFDLGGVASGTSIDGVTTDITTAANTISFGELVFNQTTEGASLLTVTTNAVSGYTVTVKQTGPLVSTSGTVFPTVSGTNASPSAWPTSLIDGAYGYHTSDHALGTGSTTRFATSNTFAQFDSTFREVAYSSAPVTSEVTYLVYSIETGKGQEAGDYSHSLTYVAAGIF